MGWTPWEYVARYHGLPVIDFRLGLNVQLNLTRYVNGWEGDNNNEWCAVKYLLAEKVNQSKTNHSLPNTFTIPNDPRMDPTEQFYAGSLHRAYECRASPDEFADALRLAVLVGRCKANDAKAYAERRFGLDCNTLAGNWLGVSPSTAIFAYVNGYGGSNPSGATPDLLASLSIVKLPPIDDPNDVGQGDLLISYMKAAKKPFHHVAVVERFQPMPDNTAVLTMVEWGEKGQIDKHRVDNKLVQLRVDACPGIPGKKVLGFPQDSGDMRYFIDAYPHNNIASRGWHIGTANGMVWGI